MKKQLRNIAFAAAVMACGSAVAQDAPAVLTPAWQQTVTASGSANVRVGQGFGGKIYLADKGGKIIVADGTTQEDYVVDERITGIGLTIDQKGNIIVNRNFPNASSATDYLLIDTEKNITELTLPSDEIESPARVDQLGRAIGDFTGEEGGVFYICPNGLNAVYGVSIVNGEMNFDTFGFSASDPITGTNSTTTIAQPRYESMADMYAAVEDGVIASASDAFYYRNRSNKYVQKFTDVDGEPQFTVWVDKLAENCTTDGFDWFSLQGKDYIVVNNSPSIHTNNFLVYCVTDAQIVATSNLTEHLAPSAQQQFSVEKISDTKVNIYTVTYGGAEVYCTCTPFEVGGGEEEGDVVYFDNTESNWSAVYAYVWGDEGFAVAWPGTELSNPVNNVYTYVLPEGVNKIIFNDNAGQQTKDLDIEVGKTYTASSEGTEPVYPVEPTAEMYVIGDMPDHRWDTAYTGGAMTAVSEGVYVIDSVEFIGEDGAYFSFITNPGADWDVVNTGKRYGAVDANTPIAIGETCDVAENWNSWKISAGTYKITFDTTTMKVTVDNPSGVETIEEENAPAVYYNLQGVEVANPSNGLYIVKRGNKVSKVMVK